MKKLLCAVLALMLLLSGVAALAEWPERSIELVVPADPGGTPTPTPAHWPPR